jgi:pilus assembly protein CpaE
MAGGDPARLRDFILAGARDCLPPPYSREALVASVRKVHMTESRRRDRLTAQVTGGLRRHRCQVIAIHGAKGGVGTTSVAVNLAVALRKLSGERIVVVDASLQAGDVAVALNLMASTGIDDLLPHMNGLDADLLNKVLVTHSSGVRALLAPRDLERAEAIGADELRRILAFLAGHFDYVVLDTAPVLDAAGLAALDHADQIVLVTTPDVPSLKNAGRFLQLSRRLGYPAEKIALVVNRVNSPHAIRLNEIEQKLAVKSVGALPNAERTFLRAANHGEVVADGAWLGGVGRNIYRLANRLAVPTSRSQEPSLPARLLAMARRRFRRGAAKGAGAAPPIQPQVAPIKADSAVS